MIKLNILEIIRYSISVKGRTVAPDVELEEPILIEDRQDPKVEENRKRIMGEESVKNNQLVEIFFYFREKI